MEREERRKMLDGVDVPEALLKELENHYRNAIYIEPTEAEVYPGCSRIGGYPHVPADFQWVRNNEGYEKGGIRFLTGRQSSPSP